jgi:hypothetical protein
VIPQIDKSLRDQVNDDSAMFNPEWLGKDPTKDDQLALKFLFHDCSPELSHWALGTMSLMFARQAILEMCPLKASGQTFLRLISSAAKIAPSNRNGLAAPHRNALE